MSNDAILDDDLCPSPYRETLVALRQRVEAQDKELVLLNEKVADMQRSYANLSNASRRVIATAVKDLEFFSGCLGRSAEHFSEHKSREV
jgi:hypothetical protein